MSDDLASGPCAVLIANERAKLTATYFNGLAIAVFAVGGLAPLFSIVLSSAPSSFPTWAVLLNAMICWFVSAGVHWIARRYLGRMTL